MKRSKTEYEFIRIKVKNLQHKIQGKYTNEEFEQIASIALEWAGYKTILMSDGSSGIIRGGEQLAMLLDVLGEILVKKNEI